MKLFALSRILVLVLVLVLVVPGCALVKPPIHQIPEIRLDATGNIGKGEGFVLRLSNDSHWDMYYLHFLVMYSKNPKIEVITSLSHLGDLFAHNVLLRAGESADIAITCEDRKCCNSPGDFAGVYVCWSNGKWDCEEYTPIWTKLPVVPSD